MGYNLGKEMPINKGRDISVLVGCSEQLGFGGKERWRGREVNKAVGLSRMPEGGGENLG